MPPPILTMSALVLAANAAWALPANAQTIHGRYVPDPSAPNAAVVERAIAETASPFFFAIRGLVTSRLRETNPVFAEIDLSFDGRSLVFRAAPLVVVAALDRQTESRGLDGSTNAVSLRRVGSSLLLRMWTSEGARLTELILRGDALDLRITVSSPRLRAPMTYTLRYVRRDRQSTSRDRARPG
jgi:hypothetical protein